MALKLFNTETRQKELFEPAVEGEVTLYTCGPTIYNFAHIGNFRTYVFEDLLRRTLKFLGFKVHQAMNLTDVDDKTIRGALAQKVSLKTFTDTYKKAFFEDLQTLNIEPVEHYPAATDYIDRMISMVEELLAKGVAYKGQDGSIYFAIKKFPSYGRLSHLDSRELKEGASERVSADEYDKDNASDFVLWKAYDKERDGDIFWESPFGKGRPGWHIECSAMATALLGKTLDIHVGGVDNMFPHHENEIAQSEACFGCRFVKYWLHAEHLLVDHKKMSKSLGNFYTLRDLLAKGFTGSEVRYLLLQTHYRTQLNFTLAGLDAARASLQRLHDFVFRVERIYASNMEHQSSALVTISSFLPSFREALEDDFNISLALSCLFDFVRHTNALIDKGAVGRDEAAAILKDLHAADNVLGVIFVAQEEVAADLQALLDKRNAARAAKNWAESDKMRDILLQAGYIIEDTPSGARLKKK